MLFIEICGGRWLDLLANSLPVARAALRLVWTIVYRGDNVFPNRSQFSTRRFCESATKSNEVGIEKTSGKPWKELPDDYMVPSQGDDAFENIVIVAGGQEEAAVELFGGRGPTFSIDAWR